MAKEKEHDSRWPTVEVEETFRQEKKGKDRFKKIVRPLNEIVLDGQMPKDRKYYQGTCDDFPKHFDDMRAKGYRVEPVEEVVHGEKKLVFYWVKGNERHQFDSYSFPKK